VKFIRFMAALLAFAFCIVTPVFAQTAAPTYIQGNQLKTADGVILFDKNGNPATPGNPLPAADANNAPFSAPTVVAVGGSFSTARSIGFLVTTAGNTVVTFTNGTAITLPVVPGWNQYPFSNCTLTSTTATETAYALN